jgi:hypothetical protein
VSKAPAFCPCVWSPVWSTNAGAGRWFEGRLDFAPVVAFEGDAEFPLKGGAIGYFLRTSAR